MSDDALRERRGKQVGVYVDKRTLLRQHESRVTRSPGSLHVRMGDLECSRHEYIDEWSTS